MAYGKVGNGNEMENGNGNWKWKMEMEIGNGNVKVAGFCPSPRGWESSRMHMDKLATTC